MKLVITEKPDVARKIAAALGCQQRGDGHIRGGEWIITWALGHLLDTAEPGEMDPAWGGAWRLDVLPMVPAEWKLVPSGDKRKQLDVVVGLLRSREVTEVVCATDAGREGELIFRELFDRAGVKKPRFRHWVSSTTREAYLEGFRTLHRGEEFDGLYAAAETRRRADWLVGMNLSRAYTLVNRAAGGDGTLHVGRVKTATLALVAHRDAEIRNFKPTPFFEVHAELEPGFVTKWAPPPDHKTSTRERPAAERVVAEIRPSREATATHVETRDVHVQAPALYDLLTLQRDANARYGFSAKETLAIAQALYEAGHITYPRTESRHISKDVVRTLPGVVKALGALYPEPSARALARLGSGEPLGKSYVDDTKLTDHHAIIPTSSVPATESLKPEELKLYRMVASRFLAIFYPPQVKSETTALFDIAGHVFRATGSTVTDPGWTAVGGEPVASAPTKRSRANESEPDEDGERAEALGPLPTFKVGERYAKRREQLVERKTAPPKPYTDGTLLLAMKKAGSQIEDEDLAAYMKASGLGTPATRATIIDELVRHAYLERRKKALVTTDRGVALLALVDPELKDPALTARWEERLAHLEERKEQAENVWTDIVSLVSRITAGVKAGTATPAAATARGAQGSAPAVAAAPAIGACPACRKGVIRESPKAYGCSRWREGCTFTIWKTIYGHRLTTAQAVELVSRRRTSRVLNLTSKAGKPYRARLVVEPETWKIGLEFEERGAA